METGEKYELATPDHTEHAGEPLKVESIPLERCRRGRAEVADTILWREEPEHRGVLS